MVCVCSCILAGILAVVVTLFVIFYDLYKKQKKVNESIEGEHVLITGGSSGIGKEVAFLASKRGANVSIIARDEKKLKEVQAEIRQLAKIPEQKINYFVADVTNYEEIENVINRCEIEVGPIDILINCAGYAHPSRCEDIPLEHVKGMMDVNYFGAFYTTRACLPSMKQRRKGKIAVVSSIAGLFGMFGYTGYSASKFALRGFAESLRMEVKPFNISVTINFPPDTDTPCLAKENEVKPIETKLIGDTAGVLQPTQVAKSLFNDTLSGDFFSTSGFDGTITTIVCAGMSPLSSLIGLLTQVLFMGIIRLVSLGYLAYFDRIVSRCASEKEKQKKSE